MLFRQTVHTNAWHVHRTRPSTTDPLANFTAHKEAGTGIGAYPADSLKGVRTRARIQPQKSRRTYLRTGQRREDNQPVIWSDDKDIVARIWYRDLTYVPGILLDITWDVLSRVDCHRVKHSNVVLFGYIWSIWHMFRGMEMCEMDVVKVKPMNHIFHKPKSSSHLLKLLNAMYGVKPKLDIADLRAGLLQFSLESLCNQTASTAYLMWI